MIASVKRRPEVAERDRLVLGAVTQHPGMTSRQISDLVLERTGGAPALWTGAVFLGAWRAYESLRRLEDAGQVIRIEHSPRNVRWETT